MTMPERVFCIDFGAAYTKVALRTGTQEAAELVKIGSGTIDFCVPTVVAADWSNGRTKPELEFGEKAAGIKPGGKIAVYTNFKRDLFTIQNSAKPTLPPLDALLHSHEFEELTAKYGVSPPAVAGLRLLVNSARATLGVPTGEQPTTRKQDEAKTVAHHFFKWLHGQVTRTCETLPHTALNYKEIPARITVPAFGSAADLDKHPGCVRLREALAGTGWRLDDRTFISEPESDAVGVLTKASNVLTKKKVANLGAMFEKGPVITVVKGDKHHHTYRALVIDVGAFTTDFGALHIKTDGKFVEATEAGWFSSILHSVPFGVSDLDENVRSALHATKGDILATLAPKDFAEFQFSAYDSDGTGYRVGPGKLLGGAADRPVIEKCLSDFIKRLVDETDAFVQQLAPVSKQELILTGGGSNIAAVRDALIAAASKVSGTTFCKIHASNLKKAKTTPLAEPLDFRLARGATALGGASIYFEKSYS